MVKARKVTAPAAPAPKRAKKVATPEPSVDESQEEAETLYTAGDYVCVWDESQKEGYSIGLLLQPVDDSDEDVQAHFFNPSKSGVYKSTVTGILETKFIVMQIPEASLDLNLPPKPKAKAAPAKRGSKKAAEDEITIPISLTLTDAKLLKQLKAAVKKFVPAESEPEEEEEEEESEEEEPVPKKAQRGRSASTSRAKPAAPPKITGAKVKPAGKKPAKISKVESEEEEEMEDPELSKAKTKLKTTAGPVAKPVKEEKKPTVFKKGKWNPNVEIVEKCHQLESDSVVPNFECSTKNSNREVIRAAMINNPKLLEKIMKSEHKITTLTDRWGVENRTTALMIALESGKKDILIPILEHLTDTKKAIKYGTANKVYLKQIDTGFNDKYAYGVATRRVALSRGGRQGNNALVEDQGNRGSGFDTEHIEFVLTSRKVSLETLKTILSYYPAIENQFLNKIGIALRYGNNEKAAYLMERSIKNGGYGLSEFYVPALTGKNAKAVAEIKKPNCTKKAFGMGNFTPIHAACLNPNAEVLKHILTVNPEYLVTDDSMRKPVHYAACCSSAEPIKILASQNVDTRENDNMKTTPIMYAARAGSVEVVKFLLAPNKSVPNGKDRHGYSAIHYAAENGHTEIVKLLLDYGVKIAHSGPDRQTALHIAAAKGNFEMVKFLIERGAKVTAKDKFKRTPLLLAAKNGNLKVASFLLQRGSLYDDGDSSGNTPLHYACAYGYTEMIDLLFKSGANPNSVNSWNLSPTAVALMKSFFSCLRRMLDNPQTNVNCIDDEGRTLVSNAIKTISAENFAHVAFLLRDKNADPNIADGKGLTPFDYLCMQNPDLLAQAEIKPNMNLEEINELKAQKKSLYKKYFKLLCDCGSNINHMDQEGLTPIFRAVQNGNIDGVNLLLERSDVDLNIVSKQGNTFLHYATPIMAAEGSYIAFTKILDRVGASAGELLNKYAHSGSTALHVLFSGFVGSVHQIQANYQATLENEAKLAKKPRSDAVVPENLAGGLLGGARTVQTARKSIGGFGRTTFGGFSNQGLNHAAGADGIALTTQELEAIQAQAENRFKDRIEEFFDLLRLFIQKGGDFNARQKKPLKEQTVTEGEEEKENSDFDYSFATYFQAYTSRILQAILSKIDLLPTDVVPENVGMGFLHLATSSSYLPIYKFLIEEAKIDVNIQTVHGENELFKLVKSGQNTDQVAEICEYLANKGISIEQENLRQDTPLLVATQGNKLIIVKKLLGLGCKTDRQNLSGNYPLLQAVKNKSLSAVETLLSYKANPNLVDENKRTSIHWAINLSNADADASNEIENLLMNSGADLNAVDSRGRTPLHYAFVKIGDPFNTSAIDPIEAVSNIIGRVSQKPELDVRDKWGNSPLNYAAQRGSVISMLHLLKQGANINNVNADGNTPLNEALINGHQTMCIFLIQKEADLTIPVKVVTEKQRQAAFEDSDEAEQPEHEKSEDDDDQPTFHHHKTYNGSRPVKIAKTARKIKKNRGTPEAEEEPEYESSESILEEDAARGEDSSDGEAKTGKSNPFAGNLNFRPTYMQVRTKMFAKSSTGFGQTQQAPNEERFTFGKKETSCTTFSLAIRRNWQSIAFLMIQYEFDLSLAILDCFQYEKFKYVYTLLLKKEDAGVYQMTNANQQNLCHLFAKSSNRINQEDLYNKILEKIESKFVDFSKKDAFGKTSLHYACESGCMKLIKTLLEKKLDPNVADLKGNTPLGALAKNSMSLVVEFAKLGKPYGLDLNKRFAIQDKHHTILTYIVSQHLNMDFMAKLNDEGADLNVGDEDGFTPLVYLVRQNREEETRNFIKTYGKKVDVKHRDKQERTLVHHAVKPRDFGAYENASLLEYLASMVDVNLKDSHGQTALDYARMQQSGKLETCLLKKCKAIDNKEGPPIKKAVTSMISNQEFPSSRFNAEEDFENWLEQCKKHAEHSKVVNEELKAQPDDRAVGNYEVVYEGEDPFDVYMIKVEISYGYYSGNTFYKMQILREKVRDIYILFTRWGRVGDYGQYQQTPFNNLDDAKKEFSSIFKSKSGNLWESRANFVNHEKKYKLVQVSKKLRNADNYLKAFNYKDPELPQTHLEKQVFKFVRRICNSKVFGNIIKFEIHMDEKALPLQDLSRERLLDAETVLKAIEAEIKEYEESRRAKNYDKIFKHAEELTKLSNQYYELIPNTQYMETSVPPITNAWRVEQLRKGLNELMYFQSAIKLLCGATFRKSVINPIDYVVGGLGVKIGKISSDTDEYKIIHEYVQIGRQGASMKNFVANIYGIERPNEREAIQHWAKIGNKALLWHGTRAENIVGILQTGFRIAPSDAARRGSMFGDGVYFADIFNKSYQYSVAANNYMYMRRGDDSKKKHPKKYVFLCEVALGKQKRLMSAEPVTGLPNDTHHSVLGYGKTGPNPKGNVYLPSGAMVPLGELVLNPAVSKEPMNLQFNEYVVYDTSQIRVRYIIECRDLGDFHGHF